MFVYYLIIVKQGSFALGGYPDGAINFMFPVGNWVHNYCQQLYKVALGNFYGLSQYSLKVSAKSIG